MIGLRATGDHVEQERGALPTDLFDGLQDRGEGDADEGSNVGLAAADKLQLLRYRDAQCLCCL